MALKKLCGRSGCNQIIDIGVIYCDKHQKEYEQREKQRNNEYKQRREDKKEQAFYSTDAWIRTRDYVKAKYKGLCLFSYFILKKIVYCDVVHHIEELKDHWELRLDANNCIPLSESVHQEIHKMYRNGKKNEAQKLLRELKIRWEGEMNGNRV